MEALTPGDTRPRLAVECLRPRLLAGPFPLLVCVEDRDTRVVVLGGDHIASLLDVRVLLALDDRALWPVRVPLGVVFLDSSCRPGYRIGHPSSIGCNPTYYYGPGLASKGPAVRSTRWSEHGPGKCQSTQSRDLSGNLEEPFREDPVGSPPQSGDPPARSSAAGFCSRRYSTCRSQTLRKW
jgi:hypothetical protein